MDKNATNIKIKLWSFMTFFLVLIAASFIQTQLALKTKKHDSLIINLSGRQTMIVHRYVKDFFYFLETNQIESVQKSIKVFEKTLEGLLHGGSVPMDFDFIEMVTIEGSDDLDIIETIQSIDKGWNGLKYFAISLIEERNRTTQNFKKLIGLSNALSEITSRATFLIQKKSEERLADIKYYQNIIYIISFVLFALSLYLFYKVVILNNVLQGKVEELKMDIAERKKAENEREVIRSQMFHSAKLTSIGELVAGVGHEINNPLAVINGNIEMINEDLVRRGHLDDVCRKSIEVIKSSIVRIANIVGGLRTFARTDTDRIEAIDIEETIESTLSFLRPIYRKEGVTINTNFSHSNELFIDGNTGRFQQVLVNLLSNAKDASEGKKDRWINISTSVQDDYVLIRVEDNGMGMRRATIDKIFDTFFTTKEVGKGTGLGMGIIKNIIENIDGKISVESVLGEGSAFTIKIPKSKGNRIIMPKHTLFEIDYEKIYGRALIVDDEEDIRDILKNYLISFGIEVEESSNGADALEKVKHIHYDYILSDLAMPGMSGEDFIKNVTAFKDFHGKIFILTGAVNTEIFQTLQISGVIYKPFDKRTVYNQLKDVVCELKIA